MAASQWFIEDEKGHTIFFPWGGKNGYVLRNRAAVRSIRRFYRASWFGPILVGAILGVAANSPMSPMVALAATVILQPLVWWLYTDRITRRLPRVPYSRTDVILNKLTQESDAYVASGPHADQFTNPGTTPERGENGLLLFASYFEQFPAGMLMAGSWLIVGIIAFIWYQFHPAFLDGDRGSLLGAAIIFFFLGLGSYFPASRIQTNGFWEFMRWKWSHVFVTGGCWLAMAYFLFKYFAG